MTPTLLQSLNRSSDTLHRVLQFDRLFDDRIILVFAAFCNEGCCLRNEPWKKNNVSAAVFNFFIPTKTAARTNEFSAIRSPDRIRTRQGKNADSGVFRSGMHQGIQIDTLQERVVRDSLNQSPKAVLQLAFSFCEVGLDAHINLCGQRGRYLSKLVVSPESCKWANSSSASNSKIEYGRACLHRQSSMYA